MLKELTETPRTAGRNSTRDLKTLHTAVAQLHAELFKARFGFEPVPWDGNDRIILEKHLRARDWTNEEVLGLIRSRFGSDGIGPDRPFQWIPDLDKYISGPLDVAGYPKRALDAMRADIGRRSTEIMEEASRRAAAEDASAAEERHGRAMSRVMLDLRKRGYEIFTDVGSGSCDLVAMRNSVSTREGLAIRVVVRSGNMGVRAAANAYLATVSDDQFQFLTYVPDLP
jgi:hypothetical protein